jgi:hypothetical protein
MPQQTHPQRVRVHVEYDLTALREPRVQTICSQIQRRNVPPKVSLKDDELGPNAGTDFAVRHSGKQAEQNSFRRSFTLRLQESLLD